MPGKEGDYRFKDKPFPSEMDALDALKIQKSGKKSKEKKDKDRDEEDTKKKKKGKSKKDKKNESADSHALPQEETGEKKGKKDEPVTEAVVQAAIAAVGELHPEGLKSESRKENQEMPLDKVHDLPGLYEALAKKDKWKFGKVLSASGWVVATIKDNVRGAEKLDPKEKFLHYVKFISRFEDKDLRRTLNRLLIDSDNELRIESLRSDKEKIVDEYVNQHVANLKAKIKKKGVKKDEIKKLIDDSLRTAMGMRDEYPSFVEKLKTKYIKVIKEAKPEDVEGVSINWGAFRNWSAFSRVNTFTDLEAELLQAKEIKWEGKVFDIQNLIKDIEAGIGAFKLVENKDEFEKQKAALLEKVPANASFVNSLQRIIRFEMESARKSRGKSPEMKEPPEEISIPLTEDLKESVARLKLRNDASPLPTGKEVDAGQAPPEEVKLGESTTTMEPGGEKPNTENAKKLAFEDFAFPKIGTDRKSAEPENPPPEALAQENTTNTKPESKDEAEEKPISGEKPPKFFGYSKDAKTIGDMLDSGNFSEFLAQYENSQDLIASEDVKGISDIYEIFGKRDKTIIGYRNLFKDYYKQTLGVTLLPENLVAIDALIEKEALENPEKFSERAKAIEEFSEQAKIMKELWAKIPGLEAKLNKLRAEKAEIEAASSSRSTKEKVFSLLFFTQASKKDDERTKRLKEIGKDLAVLEKGAGSLENLKIQRDIFEKSFIEIRRGISDEAIGGSEVTEIAMKMAQEKLKSFMSGEKADFYKAQEYLDSLKDIRDEDIDIFSADLNEEESQKTIDLALEESTKRGIMDAIDGFTLGNKSFSKLEKTISGAVKTMGEGGLGSKDRTEVAAFVKDTLVEIHEKLGDDPQSKAKRLLITAVLAKSKYYLYGH